MANIDNVQLPDGSSYNIVDNTSGFATQNYVDSAVDSITKTTIGLGNVDNTSDLNKPISTATQAALDTLDEDKADKTDIATVESGTTASRAYSVGELVYVSGTLYRVKTAIASGATFTIGTNVEVKNVSNIVSAIPTINTALNNLKGRFEGLIEVPASVTTQKLFCYNVARAVVNMSDGSTVVKNAVWAGQDYYLFVATRWGDTITGILSNRASILSFAYIRSTDSVYGIKITGTAL